MPNNISNVLSFNCDEKQLSIILDAIGDEKNAIDFNKIIPMPLKLQSPRTEKVSALAEAIYANHELKKFINSVFKKALDHYNNKAAENTDIDYKGSSVLKTFVDHQGLSSYTDDEFNDFIQTLKNKRSNVPRDAGYYWCISNWGTKWNAYDIGDGPDDALTFDTAWNPPLPVIKKISEMFPNTEINLRFADEDMGCNCGEIKFLGGNIITEYFPDNESKEAYELGFDIRGGEDYWVFNQKTGTYEYQDE